MLPRSNSITCRTGPDLPRLGQGSAMRRQECAGANCCCRTASAVGRGTALARRREQSRRSIPGAHRSHQHASPARQHEPSHAAHFVGRHSQPAENAQLDRSAAAGAARSRSPARHRRARQFGQIHPVQPDGGQDGLAGQPHPRHDAQRDRRGRGAVHLARHAGLWRGGREPTAPRRRCKAPRRPMRCSWCSTRRPGCARATCN